MTDKRDILEEQVLLTEALLAKNLGRQIDTFYATEKDREDYSVHLDIFRAGSHFRERLAAGVNRVRKPVLGSYECTLHLTGDYPDWWNGHRLWLTGQ